MKEDGPAAINTSYTVRQHEERFDLKPRRSSIVDRHHASLQWKMEIKRFEARHQSIEFIF
jgi:hypothetical protein